MGMVTVLKKLESCLYCAAPIQALPDVGFVRCESCGRVMEITRFTQEERRLTDAVDEARQSSERAAEELRRRMDALDKAQSEARQQAVETAQATAAACRDALAETLRQQENSEALQLRSIYMQAETAQRNGQFEDAEKWYRQLLVRRDGEAEIYWRLVLCRYGVEYVREQDSRRWLPTICHMVVDSVLDNADYQCALRYARSDDIRSHYEREAQAIDAILEKYRQIRATEKPYDVFISVKQGNAKGQPTPDSQIAQDLYYKLRDELGLRVFNSRISLAGHAGAEFEPYIMAALMSAKVMLVVSTRSAYINAPWVRNEWRRFRWLKDHQPGNRRLIVYVPGKNVKDIPSAMGDLQAINSDSVNAVDSLLRSMREVFGVQRPQLQQVAAPGQDPAKLLELASISLEYGEFEKADEYCEKALYLEPRSARAYALRLCAELKARSFRELAEQEKPIDGYINYKKALSFAGEEDRQILEDCNQAILDRIEAAKQAERFASAVEDLDRLEGMRLETVDEARRLLAEVLRAALEGRVQAESKKREARDELADLEKREISTQLDAMRLFEDAHVLLEKQKYFEDFPDGDALRSRYHALLEKYGRYLPVDDPPYGMDAQSVCDALDSMEGVNPQSDAEVRQLLQKLAELEEECNASQNISFEESVNLKSRIINLRRRFERVAFVSQRRKNRIREAVEECEKRCVTNRSEVLRLSGDVQELMKRHDDFRDDPDGDALRARCGDLLTKCAQYLSEGTDEGSSPGRNQTEQRSWKNLAALEEEVPETLAECADLDERLRLLSNDHNGFREYDGGHSFKNRIAAKRAACAQSAAKLTDSLLEELEAKTVTWQSAAAFRGQLKTIWTCTRHFELLSEPERADLRRRYEALLAQCDQAEGKESPESECQRQPERQRFDVNLWGGALLAGVYGAVMNSLSKGLLSGWVYQNGQIVGGITAAIFALSMLFEALFFGKDRFERRTWGAWIKIGVVLLLTALMLAMLAGIGDLTVVVGAYAVHNCTNFLVGGGMSIYMLISAFELFHRKKTARALVASTLFVGLTFYFLIFLG